MAKRARAGRLSPKSTRRPKKASPPPPASAGRSQPDRGTKSRQPDLGSQPHAHASQPSAAAAQSDGGFRERSGGSKVSLRTKKGTAGPAASARSDRTEAPTQRLGIGRRVRTPPPVAGHQETRARPQFGRFRDLPQNSDRGGPGGRSIQSLGTGTRIRTAPPRSAAAGREESKIGGQGQLARLLERLPNSAEPGALAASPALQKLQERAAQYKHVQEFLQNPTPFNDLRREVGTSSTPEEIESRQGEIRYQMQIMQSVLAVLQEELKDLEHARPKLKPQ
jgi:hypothetical protein